MNELYKNIVISNIKKVLNDTGFADNFNNMVLRGRAREIIIKNFLRPYLSPMIGICTGIVIDSFNQQSKQIDIIIFDQSIVPPSMGSEEEGIIPYESVLATIEVKTTIDKNSLKESILNARSIKHLKSNFDNITGSPKFINSPACYLFSYSTNTFKRKTVLKSLTELNDEINKNDNEKVFVPISSICILNNVFINCINASQKPEFAEKISDNNIDLILEFMINILNTCNIFSSQREKQFIGKYLR